MLVPFAETLKALFAFGFEEAICNSHAYARPGNAGLPQRREGAKTGLRRTAMTLRLGAFA